jgi:hypothetical protein
MGWGIAEFVKNARGSAKQAVRDGAGSVTGVTDSVVPEFNKAWRGAQYSLGNTWSGFRRDVFGLVLDLTGQTPKRPPGPVTEYQVAQRGTDKEVADTSSGTNDGQLRAFAESSTSIAKNPLAGNATVGTDASLGSKAPLGRNMILGN